MEITCAARHARACVRAYASRDTTSSNLMSAGIANRTRHRKKNMPVPSRACAPRQYSALRLRAAGYRAVCIISFSQCAGMKTAAGARAARERAGAWRGISRNIKHQRSPSYRAERTAPLCMAASGRLRICAAPLALSRIIIRALCTAHAQTRRIVAARFRTQAHNIRTLKKNRNGHRKRGDIEIMG